MAIPFTLADKSHHGGYTYYVTSERWKHVCTYIPSFVWVEWPSYVSANRPVTVTGENGVTTELEIQCWKGWCGDLFQHFNFGLKISFPGGVGAEVGIYNPKKPEADAFFQKVLTGQPLLFEAEPQPLLDPFNAAVEFWKYIREQAKQADKHKSWWADDDAVKATKRGVQFTLFDPDYDAALLNKYQTDTYWTCKWMDEDSYQNWRSAHQPKFGATPKKSVTREDIAPYDYTLKFSFDGVDYIWPGGSPKIWTTSEWRAEQRSLRRAGAGA